MKNHLAMKMNFALLKIRDEKHLMYSKSDDEEIMTGFDTGKLIEELFKSLLHTD